MNAARLSSPEGIEDESIEEMKATTHATIEVKTIDALSSGNVNLICSESKDRVNVVGRSVFCNKTLSPRIVSRLPVIATSDD